MPKAHLCTWGAKASPSGPTMGRRQVGRGSFMLWSMLCWETLGRPGNNLTLTCTTYLKTTYTPSWHWRSLMAVAFFSRVMHSATLQTFVLRNMTSSGCCLGLQISQISIRLSIYGICWTNKSDPWRPHLTTCQTSLLKQKTEYAG